LLAFSIVAADSRNSGSLLELLRYALYYWTQFELQGLKDGLLQRMIADLLKKLK
jgi:hypothetical protein